MQTQDRKTRWPVRAIGDDAPDCRRTHARGNNVSPARCKIGARAFGCWSREVNADRKSGWAGETGAPTSVSGALE